MTQRTNLDDVYSQAREIDGAATLQRTLSARQLLMLGVGVIVGAGIFVATGTVAATYTGPAIILSFLLASVACLCAALCYAEFAAMMPISGSAYSYVRAAFGPALGWMIGWCLTLEYLMAAANLAVGWAGYLRSLLGSFGIQLPTAIVAPPYVLSGSGELTRTESLLNVPAIVMVGVLTLLLIGGVRLSVRMNALLVAAKLTVIILFIVCGAFFVNPDNWQPFVPENTGTFGEYGWSGVLRGAAVVFYAYLGFDAISTAAREARDPQRTMPIAIIGSLALVTVIYIAFAFVLTGLAPYTALGVPNPASVALDHAGPSLYFLKIGVEIGALIGLTSVVLVLLYAQTRVLYAMARDGLVPPVFGRIGARSHTPYLSALICGVITAVAAAAFPVEVLGELISIGTLAAFVFVCGSVLYLRITKPELERPFRTPCAPLVCIGGILICGYLLIGLPSGTWLRFLAWTAVGVAIYLLYGRWQSSRVQALPARVG